jgi:aspartate racemase
MRVLGLIGGISWASTIDYYRGINEEVNRRLGGSQYPQLAIYSLNYGQVQDIGKRDAWHEFLELTTRIGRHLRETGAEGLLLCANTAHIVADELQQRLGIPVINIVDETAKAISAKRLSTVALLGTRYTMEMDFFKDRLNRAGITPIIPNDEDRAFIHATIFDELGRGEIRPATKARYLDIISKLEAQGAEGAILGCTEIPMLIKAGDSHLPLFDTTGIHVQAAADFITS